MDCPNCNDSNSAKKKKECRLCQGTGTVCNACGWTSPPGQNICPQCAGGQGAPQTGAANPE